MLANYQSITAFSAALTVTYDVQSVEVVSLPGALRMTCYFATGSQALGCHVNITRSGLSEFQAAIPIGSRADRSTAYLLAGLQAGAYTVTVTDIESNGTVTLPPAHQVLANITTLAVGTCVCQRRSQ